VFSFSEQDAQIVDLWGIPRNGIALALLNAVSEIAREASAQTLQALVTDRSQHVEVLQKAHFRYRNEAAYVVAYAQPGSSLDGSLTGRHQWSFCYADIAA